CASPRPRPRTAAPHATVTTRRPPGRATDRLTAVPLATCPATATETTRRGEGETSPPTSDMAYSDVASSMPPYRSTTHAGSVVAGSPRETRPYRGLPPMAATSLTFTAMDL